ncbi:hypothetical protein ACSBR1_037786 [Camellia fascicularis]|uniref:uncharacterized protein LOC114309649 n=1 Tax=Camellia sinensis TaxID=4442 RepID=UPI001035C3B2|nr:uncharacterized protein LOC114309649 [Camellia sinensis]
MADYRSNSYAGDGRMQIHSYYGGHRPTSNPHDFRSFNASYVCYPPPPQTQMDGVKGLKLKKRKSSIGSSSKSWGLKDPEFQRKKRVASYKAYAVEGKVKGSLRKSFKWLKDRYTRVVYGFW